MSTDTLSEVLRGALDGDVYFALAASWVAEALQLARSRRTSCPAWSTSDGWVLVAPLAALQSGDRAPVKCLGQAE